MSPARARAGLDPDLGARRGRPPPTPRARFDGGIGLGRAGSAGRGRRGAHQALARREPLQLDLDSLFVVVAVGSGCHAAFVRRVPGILSGDPGLYDNRQVHPARRSLPNLLVPIDLRDGVPTGPSLFALSEGRRVGARRGRDGVRGRADRPATSTSEVAARLGPRRRRQGARLRGRRAWARPPLDATHGAALHAAVERIPPLLVLFPAGGAGPQLGPGAGRRGSAAPSPPAPTSRSARRPTPLADGVGRIFVRRWRARSLVVPAPRSGRARAAGGRDPGRARRARRRRHAATSRSRSSPAPAPAKLGASSSSRPRPTSTPRWRWRRSWSSSIPALGADVARASWRRRRPPGVVGRRRRRASPRRGRRQRVPRIVLARRRAAPPAIAVRRAAASGAASLEAPRRRRPRRRPTSCCACRRRSGAGLRRAGRRRWPQPGGAGATAERAARERAS